MQKSSSWSPPTQQESSPLVSRPFTAQTQENSQQSPTHEDSENAAFDQTKFEATRLQCKQQSGTITPVEQAQLGVLQANMDNFWTQKLERTSRMGHSFATMQPHPPGQTLSAPIQPQLALQPDRPGMQPASPPCLQPKLSIGTPGDKYEQEADSVARQVIQHIYAPKLGRPQSAPALQQERLPDEDDLPMKPILQRESLTQEDEELQMQPMLQREIVPDEDANLQLKSDILPQEPLPDEEETGQAMPDLLRSLGDRPHIADLQMKPFSQVQREVMADEPDLQPKRTSLEPIAGGDASTELESTINSARGRGQSLDFGLQQQMGQVMGADFRGVKVHTDATADRLNRSIQAKAFTTGQDIFFKRGAYHPGSREGQELIAHELTHVVQQTGRGRQSSSVQATTSHSSLVQRLMSQEELLTEAGQPRADTMFGMKKKSKRYKRLLATLQTYHELSAKKTIPPVELDEKQNIQDAEIVEALNAVETACQVFVDRYDQLTGVRAWKNSVERARLDKIKELQADIHLERKALAAVQDSPTYEGKTWKKAVLLYKAQDPAAQLKTKIQSIPEDKSAIATIRDEILSLESAEVKELLLNDQDLRQFIKTRLDKRDALVLASVLLDRALEWWSGSGPDAKEDFQIQDREDGGKRNNFAHWIRGGQEDSDSKPDLSVGTMNCWEGVLFSMYVAGVVSYDTLRQMHEQAAKEGGEAHQKSLEKMQQDPDYAQQKIVDARLVRQVGKTRDEINTWYEQEIKGTEKYANYEANAAVQMGTNAYYFRIAENLGAHGAQEWKEGDEPPPAGDVVFFVGGKPWEKIQKYTIAHVCISLGIRSDEGTDIMNFGFTANSKTIWGRTTIEGFLNGKYKGYLCKYGPSTLLDNTLSLEPARSIETKDELL